MTIKWDMLMHRMHSKAATDGSLIVRVGWREEEVLYDLNKHQYLITPQNTQQTKITIFNQYERVEFFEKKINTSSLMLPPFPLFCRKTQWTWHSWLKRICITFSTHTWCWQLCSCFFRHTQYILYTEIAVPIWSHPMTVLVSGRLYIGVYL